MADGNNQQNRIPFTDEQRDFLMDYLYNKFMEDMMRDEMRRNDPYNQPPPTDSQGNIIFEASMPGNLNKAESNMLMSLLDDGIKNTKREGIMIPGNLNKREAEMLMANDRIIQLDSLVDPDMDPGDLRTIYDEMMRESGGNYPGVSFDDFLKNIGTRTAKAGLPGTLSREELKKLMNARTASEGGVMFLEPGGSVRIPSTYGNKSFEDFLKDLGFTKVDENTGKVRGSKG